MENKKCLVWLPKQSKSREIIFYAKADGEISFNESLMGMNDSVRAQICRLRSTEYHSEEYNKIKETIPMVWTGAYSYSWLRRKAEVSEIYNIITIDVDYAENKELFDKEGIEVINACTGPKKPRTIIIIAAQSVVQVDATLENPTVEIPSPYEHEPNPLNKLLIKLAAPSPK